MEEVLSTYIKQLGVKDETFHSDQAGNYVLHMHVDHQNGFSFSVFDSPRNKFIALESYIPRKKSSDNQDFLSFIRLLLSQLPELTRTKFKEVHLSFSCAIKLFVRIMQHPNSDERLIQLASMREVLRLLDVFVGIS